MEKLRVTRKTDKRTLYTKGAIKDALLKTMENKPFEKITITDICKEAEINRGTYYLHYYELTEVLDELIEDAFADTRDLLIHMDISDRCSDSQCSDFCLCQIIRHSQKYQVLFLDDSLTVRIIEKIATLYKEDFVTEIMERCKINKNQAEAIFYFQVNGCFAISKSGRGLACSDWREIRNVIDGFIKGGLKQLFSGDVP